MGIFKRIIAGNDNRTSRLHTEMNELVPLGSVAQDMLGVVTAKLQTTLGGRRPVVPWWPTRVIPLVEAFLQPHMAAIEFGSGSSSIWTASRVESLLSVDDNPAWAIKTRERLAEAGITNSTVTLAEGEAYWSMGKGGTFDFACVDGSWRWKCIEDIGPRMRPGGLIYFDNADADKDAKWYSEPGSRHLAQDRMEKLAAARPGARLEKVRSLIHGELFAGEGWLLYLP